MLDYGLPRPLGIRDVLPQGIAIVALMIATAITCVRWPRAGFLGVVFFLTLAPTSSVIPISSEVGAERRMYVPMMAAAVLAVAAGHGLLARAQGRFAPDPRAWTLVAGAASAAVVIALGASTMVRNAIFADGVRLWRGAVEERPHGRARLSLGMALEQAGQREEAIRQLQMAIADYREANYALGTELYLAGRVDEAIDALTQFVDAQPSSPSRIPARSLLGRAYAAQKNFEAAEAQFRAVAELAPVGHGRPSEPWRPVSGPGTVRRSGGRVSGRRAEDRPMPQSEESLAWRWWARIVPKRPQLISRLRSGEIPIPWWPTEGSPKSRGSDRMRRRPSVTPKPHSSSCPTMARPTTFWASCWRPRTDCLKRRFIFGRPFGSTHPDPQARANLEQAERLLAAER